jgi:glycerophosphoryl diester phosphodiesterase
MNMPMRSQQLGREKPCNQAPGLGPRASQFRRHLLGRIGIPDRYTDAWPSVVKFIKYSTFRAFLAPFKEERIEKPDRGRLRTAIIVSFSLAILLSGCCLHRVLLSFESLEPQAALKRLKVAHRGNIAHPVLADNSLAALRTSLKAGVEFLEVDVRQADDGTLFLFHDGSFSRSNSNAASNLHGIPVAKIASSTRSTVTLDSDHKETIPTLADALELLKQGSNSQNLSTLQLDLKGESDALALAVLELAERRGALNRVLVQLRTAERAEFVLAKYPNARILIRCTSDKQLADALKYRIEAVELERWISSEAIRQAHARGVLVAFNVATSCLDQPTDHEYLRSRGVDIIMTDVAN